MTLFNPHALRNQLQPSQSVLGIDPGSKQIGLALSDISLMLASPLTIVMRKKLKQMLPIFQELCAQHAIGGIVVGLPLSLDGSFGPAARAAHDWAKDLSERLNIPTCLWDERLSSSAVNRFLIQEADMSRKKRGDVVDKMAAAYMLQGWLDATIAS
ncbi:Holliday junction resolvase RuvX [Bombella sp. ESL0385]|uniref:Holliday junction resolvase RuvX n=1 Tax=Bombella sp. ESL0385 TaxID=2676446 RepID=UPI0012D92230|nr:Holliday junction resolvase RuvX [Bombella sp. ESL0385]MUG90119.1 Holliday junction resolvase RuvX [Bombella sp. ESL0385]